jgi:hypothetical protein
MACEISEWGSDSGKVGNETSVVVGKTEEGLDGFDGGGCGPVTDGGNLRRVGANTSGRNEVTAIFDLGEIELAFFAISDKAVMCEALED